MSNKQINTAPLFFLRYGLRLSIAFLWIFTGAICLFGTAHAQSLVLLQQMGVPVTWQAPLEYATSALDLLLGVATLINYRLQAVGAVQCVLMLAYLILISIYFPADWLQPFGSVSKNIPLMFATLVMMALERSR